jgi:hypothetical protein
MERFCHKTARDASSMWSVDASSIFSRDAKFRDATSGYPFRYATFRDSRDFLDSKCWSRPQGAASFYWSRRSNTAQFRRLRLLPLCWKHRDFKIFYEIPELLSLSFLSRLNTISDKVADWHHGLEPQHFFFARSLRTSYKNLLSANHSDWHELFAEQVHSVLAWQCWLAWNAIRLGYNSSAVFLSRFFSYCTFVFNILV